MPSYSYPHVNITQRVLKRSATRPAAEDTVVLFAPIYTEKGPIEEPITVHTLSEFIDKFGNLNYDVSGQMALNVYNWLSNGGSVCVYRLNVYGNTDGAYAVSNFKLGTYRYNQLNVTLDSSTTYSEAIQSIGNLYVEQDDNYEAVTIETITSEVTDNYLGFKITNGNESVYYCFNSGEGYFAGTSEEDPNNDGTTISASTSLTLDFLYEREEVVDDPLFSAKYPGSFYKKIFLDLKFATSLKNVTADTIVSVSVIENTTTVERFVRVKVKDLENSFNLSDYIKLNIHDVAKIVDGFKSTNSDETEIKIALDLTDESIFASLESSAVEKSLIESFFKSGSSDVTSTGARKVLANPLYPNVDIIMDAGYSEAIKKEISKFVKESNENQIGLIAYIDRFAFDNTNPSGDISKASPTAATLDGNVEYSDHIIVNDQYLTIYDNIFVDKNIYVMPSFYLSSLIPYNEITNGIQYPVAGLRRAILNGALAINENPTPSEKETKFSERINYIEKSPREYALMSQRTFDKSSNDEYTALSFANNVRTLERIKKDIVTIGRNYLFEFNDSTTISNMSNALNKYITGWISNRTLKSGSVIVERDPYSDETINVILNIRFAGTVEIISVDLTIE